MQENRGEFFQGHLMKIFEEENKNRGLKKWVAEHKRTKIPIRLNFYLKVELNTF